MATTKKQPSKVQLAKNAKAIAAMSASDWDQVDATAMAASAAAKKRSASAKSAAKKKK